MNTLSTTCCFSNLPLFFLSRFLSFLLSFFLSFWTRTVHRFVELVEFHWRQACCEYEDFLNRASIRTLESILSQEDERRKREMDQKGSQERCRGGSLLANFVIILPINDRACFASVAARVLKKSHSRLNLARLVTSLLRWSFVIGETDGYQKKWNRKRDMHCKIDRRCITVEQRVFFSSFLAQNNTSFSIRTKRLSFLRNSCDRIFRRKLKILRS